MIHASEAKFLALQGSAPIEDTLLQIERQVRRDLYKFTTKFPISNTLPVFFRRQLVDILQSEYGYNVQYAPSLSYNSPDWLILSWSDVKAIAPVEPDLIFGFETGEDGNFYFVLSDLQWLEFVINKSYDKFISLSFNERVLELNTEYEISVFQGNTRFRVFRESLTSLLNSNISTKVRFTDQSVDFVFKLYSDESEIPDGPPDLTDQEAVDQVYEMLSSFDFGTLNQENTPNIIFATAQINQRISTLPLNGVTVSIIDTNFIDPVIGTLENPNGINGTFVFNLLLSKGEVEARLYGFNVVIVALPYGAEPPLPGTGEINFPTNAQDEYEFTYTGLPLNFSIGWPQDLFNGFLANGTPINSGYLTIGGDQANTTFSISEELISQFDPGMNTFIIIYSNNQFTITWRLK